MNLNARNRPSEEDVRRTDVCRRARARHYSHEGVEGAVELDLAQSEPSLPFGAATAAVRSRHANAEVAVNENTET